MADPTHIPIAQVAERLGVPLRRGASGSAAASYGAGVTPRTARRLAGTMDERGYHGCSNVAPRSPPLQVRTARETAAPVELEAAALATVSDHRKRYGACVVLSLPDGAALPGLPMTVKLL